jgi:hypothetical protein
VAQDVKATETGAIEGIIDPVHDTASFIGTVVPNEGGTISQPEDCVLKEVKVHLSAPFVPEGSEQIYAELRRRGVPPDTDAYLKQLTLTLKDGG